MNTRASVLFALLVPIFAQIGGGDWKQFSPSDKAFTAEFPGTPAETKTPIKTGLGITEVVVFQFQVTPGEGSYSVSSSEYPEGAIKPGTEDKRFNNVRDSAVSNSKGKLKREKALMLDVYPGREVYIEVEGKASVVLRMYAVKNRLYEVVAAGNAEFVTSKETARFLDSFKLTK